MARPKGDMFRNLRKPGEIDSLSIEELTEQTPSSVRGLGGQTPSDGQTPLPKPLSVAPERDFNRRANSLERDAMPSGMFPGTSKKLYDALYLRTRGAIKPVRTVYATKKDLTAWAGIKNRKTIDAHMRYFQMIGLVLRQWVPGQNEGYQFEVLLPEEIAQGDRPPVMVRPLQSSDQKRVRGTDRISGSGGQTQLVESQLTFNDPKTFKTKEEKTNDDDAALAKLTAALKTAHKELTGKELSRAEADRWGEVADVLIAELKIAAARTTVSSVPSFLAEHLRRRLWKIDKKQARAEGRELPDQIATSSAPTEQAKECPDCGGSGWWYPNGMERGVAKCKHERLKEVADKE
jgi:hypothetical protein